MKIKNITINLLAISIVTLTSLTAQAQQADSTDLIIEKTTITISPDSWTIGKKDQSKSVENKIKYPRVYGGITFSRIDWGFARLMDDGKFSLSEDNKFMSYSKSSNFGFDVAQFGVRFTDQFKIYLSTGFEWNYIRLKQSIVFQENQSPIQYEITDPNEPQFRKNVFTSTYLRVPLTFEYRTAQINNRGRLKFAAGPIAGILLKGTQRIKTSDGGKIKRKDNYNLQSFQLGGFARIGYDNFGIFGKYYFSDFFENSPQQEGLNNFAFGLTLGF